MPSSKTKVVFITLGTFILYLFIVRPAEAYVDPGTTGMLSQILYVLFYGALGVFLYLLRYIKQYVARAKESLAKLFGPRA